MRRTIPTVVPLISFFPPQAVMMNAQAVCQLLEASIDTEELVRTSALASLRIIASSKDKVDATLRAAVAFLQANQAVGNMTEKTVLLRKRVHILRAIATIGEVGSLFISPDLAHSVATMAVDELLASKEQIAGWELSATHVLVSLCPLHMQTVLSELVDRMKPGNPPNASIVYALESVASGSSEAFVGGMARVTSRIVPMLGSIQKWKLQVQVANAFSAFCEAVNTHRPVVPSEIAAAVNSVCDVFLVTWLSSPRAQVRGATARALGAMTHILDPDQAKEMGPELMVKLLDLLKREDPASDSRVDLAMGLHGVMVAVAASSLGDPVLQQIIMSLHPMVATSPNYERPNFNRARNELLRCAEILTVHHPRAMIEHVIKCMASSSGTSQHIGAISVMTHLINSKSESVEVAGMKESVLSGKHFFCCCCCCCCGRTTFGFVAVCVCISPPFLPAPLPFLC